tara:strand:- start:1497 stop:1832 length:336 start_codon:yes stop_codon:yes gene_type:complete
MHPLKYVPQIMHINRRESVEDISLHYVGSEVILNCLSTSLTLKMILETHNFIYFLPIFCEKTITLGIILYILYLKKFYTTNENLTWNDVSSIDSLDEDINETWRNVLSNED